MSERRALRRRTLRSVVVAASTWAAAGAAVSVPDPRPLALALVVATLVSFVVLLCRRGVALVVLTVALAFGAAAAWGVASTAPTRALVDEVRLDGGRQLTVSVTVTGRVDVRPDGTAWFDAIAEAVTAGPLRVSGAIPARVAVAVDARDALQPVGLGSTVTVTGRASPSDPTERAVLLVRAETVDVTTPPPGVWGALEDVRRALVHSAVGLPQPGAGLVPGLAVGDTSMLDSTTETAMNASSLSHLTAVSGANCAIVVGAAFAVLALCGAPRAVRIGGATVVLAAFVALVTPEPSVIRAAAMALVALFALSLGRPAVGMAVLSLAVTVLLVVDPWLSLSIGFALSAAATAALLVLARPPRDRTEPMDAARPGPGDRRPAVGAAGVRTAHRPHRPARAPAGRGGQHARRSRRGPRDNRRSAGVHAPFPSRGCATDSPPWRGAPPPGSPRSPTSPRASRRRTCPGRTVRSAPPFSRP